MLRMREHGIQDRENAQLYMRKPKCSGSGGNYITVSLIDTEPAMLILIWGMLFALLVLTIEYLIKWHLFVWAKIKQTFTGTYLLTASP